MLTNYISALIDFSNIPEWKYENCITRKEYERQLSEEYEKEEYKPDANGACLVNPKLLRNTDGELFAGDKIIGYFSDGERNSLCLYEWKQNNPRSIKAYSLLLKLEEGMLVDDDIQLINAHSPSNLELCMDKRKILLTL